MPWNRRVGLSVARPPPIACLASTATAQMRCDRLFSSPADLAPRMRSTCRAMGPPTMSGWTVVASAPRHGVQVCERTREDGGRLRCAVRWKPALGASCTTHPRVTKPPARSGAFLAGPYGEPSLARRATPMPLRTIIETNGAIPACMAEPYSHRRLSLGRA